MATNPFWNMAARGGAIPHTFDLSLWKEAWNKSLRDLRYALINFQDKPNWDSYYVAGRAINRASILREAIVHIPLFLGGCSEEQQKHEEQQSVKAMESTLRSVKDRVLAFLEKQAVDGPLERRQEAKREQLYWAAFSPERAECTRIEHEMMAEERPMVFSRLWDMECLPTMKARFREKARSMGIEGYAINVRDHDVNVVVGVQSQEMTRKAMWEAVQAGSPTQKQVDACIDARLNWAYDSGRGTYMELLNARTGGLTFQTVARHIKQQMTDAAPVYNALHQAMLVQGMGKTTWNGSMEDAHQPWNEIHLLDAATTPMLDLMGREFPLKRVLEYIIPDLLAVGGWRVLEKPQRIGKGKQCMFLYHMTNGQRNAMLYFAPYPHASRKDADPYQAYAAPMRERWTGVNSKPTTPIALVAQNLALHNGCLEDLDQLRFLAHEIGHVLHYFSFEGRTFDEYTRMPNNIAELPSLLLEQIANQPETLREWANPKAPKGMRTLRYWQRRVRPSGDSLLAHMQQMEETYLDIRANSHDHAPDLMGMRKRLRKDVGLHKLHAKDNGVYKMFDFTEHAGMTCTYLIGNAISQALMGGKPSDAKIRLAMGTLLDRILVYGDEQFEANWKSTYGKSIHQMFVDGFKRVGREHLRRARASIKKMSHPSVCAA